MRHSPTASSHGDGSTVVHDLHYLKMTRRPLRKGAPPAQVHPQDTNQGVAPCRVRLPRRWDNHAHRHSSICHREVGHPLSKLTRPHESRSPTEPTRAGNTGSSSVTPGQPQKTPSWARGHLPGDARPERHQGRVAQLTHNAALASSGRRAPHSTASPMSSPSQDEWVGGRGISQRRSMALPTCRRCKRISVLDPCRRCATAKESEHYPALPASEEVA